MLRALTDEQAAIHEFGSSPFVKTRHGWRYTLADDPVIITEVGETHRDQCLATFAALNLPLETTVQLKSGACTLTELLCDSIATFSFGQREPAWTAIAYAKYLPPRREWANQFGERATFSQMVQQLLALDPDAQSCAGTHVFQALVKLSDADRRDSILDNQTRKHLESYLSNTLAEIVHNQQPDGSWDKHWSKPLNEDKGPSAPFQMSFLVTGHLLETLSVLPPARRLSSDVCSRAVAWVQQALNSKEFTADASSLCPFTHAVGAVRRLGNSFHTITANNLTADDDFHRAEERGGP